LTAPIPYDPTLRSLFFPEKDAPLADFSTDWERDQICAELCRLSYVRFEQGDEAKLREALARAGFTGKPRCFHNKRTGAQGFGAVAPDGTIFVTFRGTKITSPRDIFADLAAPPVRWMGKGRVHWGFWNAFRSLRGEVETWLGGLAEDCLVVTGHSLGAAMATLMAAVHPEAALVTFGSPRVGTRAFVEPFAGRSVRRYVDCVDGAPGLPPPLGYRHVGEMAYIDHLGRIHSPPPDAETLSADRRIGRKVYRRKYMASLRNVWLRAGADHAPINYISALLGRREGP
jgi:pimeloyl-ACP methyl ester carboxylesterase